jgi:hypothetical protein
MKRLYLIIPLIQILSCCGKDLSTKLPEPGEYELKSVYTDFWYTNNPDSIWRKTGDYGDFIWFFYNEKDLPWDNYVKREHCDSNLLKICDFWEETDGSISCIPGFALCLSERNDSLYFINPREISRGIYHITVAFNKKTNTFEGWEEGTNWEESTKNIGPGRIYKQYAWKSRIQIKKW